MREKNYPRTARRTHRLFTAAGRPAPRRPRAPPSHIQRTADSLSGTRRPSSTGQIRGKNPAHARNASQKNHPFLADTNRLVHIPTTHCSQVFSLVHMLRVLHSLFRMAPFSRLSDRLDSQPGQRAHRPRTNTHILDSQRHLTPPKPPPKRRPATLAFPEPVRKQQPPGAPPACKPTGRNFKPAPSAPARRVWLS